MIEIPRRKFITGLVSLIAAPAIVRANSLMPVKLYDFLTLDEYAQIILNPIINNLKLKIGDFVSIAGLGDDKLFKITVISSNEFYK